jgi:hypothetical protein
MREEIEANLLRDRVLRLLSVLLRLSRVCIFIGWIGRGLLWRRRRGILWMSGRCRMSIPWGRAIEDFKLFTWLIDTLEISYWFGGKPPKRQTRLALFIMKKQAFIKIRDYLSLLMFS